MKCSRCGKEIIAIDYPESGEMYHAEDTEWACPPQEAHDPGWLTSKYGAKPSKFCQGPNKDEV